MRVGKREYPPFYAVIGVAAASKWDFVSSTCGADGGQVNVVPPPDLEGSSWLTNMC